jgi:hypothetical protein
MNLFNYNWIRNPFKEGQDSFIFEIDNFITLGNGKQNTKFVDFLELFFTRRPTAYPKVYIG